MYIVTLYSTDQSDPDYIPDTIITYGDTIDELIAGISDELAESFGTDPAIPGPSVKDNLGNPIEDNIASVCQAIHDGTTCIVVDFPTYRNVYTILNI